MRIKAIDLGESRGIRNVLMAIAALLVPTLAMAQTGVVVDGRVTELGGPDIQNAIVVLEGKGPTLTAAGGVFRFEGVETGEHVIRVEAFGYVSASRTLVVDGDATLIIALDIAPVQLDSLVAALRGIDLEGRIRDAGRDVSLTGADVLTSQGHLTRTNGRGRFDFEVWEGIPILVRIRAFGYLPLDTILVPVEDESHLFDLAVDPLVERMIETEITRLEERAGGRLAVTMPPLNREDLLRWRGATLRDVLQAEYPLRVRRIRCVVVDERVLEGGMAGGVLQTTLAQDVERIEFLFQGGMLRVYTREFMRTMLGGGLELRRPTYADMARPPLCT